MTAPERKAEPEPDYKAAKEWAESNLQWRSHRNAIIDNVASTVLALSARVEALEQIMLDDGSCQEKNERDCDRYCNNSKFVHAEARAILAQRSKTP